MVFCPYTNRIPYGLLTDEEKKILKAEGPWQFRFVDTPWQHVYCPEWNDGAIYCRKKMPVIEKRTVFCSPAFGRGYYNDNERYPVHTHKITYNIVDGEVDVFSCKMEKL